MDPRLLDRAHHGDRVRSFRRDIDRHVRLSINASVNGCHANRLGGGEYILARDMDRSHEGNLDRAILLNFQLERVAVFAFSPRRDEDREFVAWIDGIIIRTYAHQLRETIGNITGHSSRQVLLWQISSQEIGRLTTCQSRDQQHDSQTARARPRYPRSGVSLI